MDARQYLLELRTLMRAATWSLGTQELVLGNRVYAVMDGLEEEAVPPPPCALITPGNYEADPQIPSLHLHDYHVVVVVPVLGDNLGEAAIVGGPRSGSVLGSTLGRGVLEVSQALLASVRMVTGADGLPIQCVLGSGAKGRPVGEHRGLVAQQHLLRAWVTADPEWLAPGWFTATKSGADVNLAWALPPSIGSFRRVLVQYLAGSTPPASATDGATVYAGTAASATHTPASFPASYAIFAAYTETGAAADQAYSENEPWTRRTVT